MARSEAPFPLLPAHLLLDSNRRDRRARDRSVEGVRVTRPTRLRLLRMFAFLAVVAAASYSLNQLQTHENARLRTSLAQQQRKDNAKIAHTLVIADRKITAAQLSACARGNVLRKSLNGDTAIVQLFMRAVVKAAQAKKGPTAQKRADLYQYLASQLHLAKPVNCTKAIG